jgi:hypothetical protein
MGEEAEIRCYSGPDRSGEGGFRAPEGDGISIMVVKGSAEGQTLLF